MDKIRTIIRWGLWPTVLGCMILIAGSPASGQDDGDGAATEAGLQELTRGPIHEAFAEPVNFNPKPGVIIKKEPPKPIEELPPEQKPEGDNVVFLGGYWSYDEDKDDFFYTSGIYRLTPPGKEWVGGYWNKIDEGWQWVNGYWKHAVAEAESGTTSKQQVEYYPEPPPSLENGANTTAPTADHVWVPGCHTWYTNRYVWRGGYWIVPQANWVWVPSHYNWTPCGYVFIEGYWDYVIARRGIVFAPCYIDPVVYLRPRDVYCPRLVIDMGLCTDHLFVHTGYNHYCFGDYYHERYVSFGIRPWFSFHYSSGHHCPIYSHYRWTYARSDAHWEVNLRERYRTCRDHVELRPARTYVQQQTVINNITINKNVNVTNVNAHKLALAKPLNQVAKGGVGDPKLIDPKAPAPLKFEKVTKDDRQLMALKANEVKKHSNERLTLESQTAKDLKLEAGKPRPGTAKEAKPLTLDLPKSSLTSKIPAKGGALKDAPPPIPAGSFKPQLKGGTGGDKPIVGGGNKPIITGGDKPAILDKPGGGKPVTGGDKPIINKPGGDKPIILDKPGGGKPPTGGDKPIINKPGGDKPIILDKPGGGKPPTGSDKSPVINKPPPPSGGSGKPPVSSGTPPSSGGSKFVPPTSGGSGKPPVSSGSSSGGGKSSSSSGGKPKEKEKEKK